MSVACAKCDRSGPLSAVALAAAGWEEHTFAMTGGTFLVCGDCARRAAPGARATGDSAGDQLRLFIERIERLEEEKRGIGGDIKDVYSELKSVGFDAKVTREIVKMRRLDPNAMREQEALLETYKAALGME